MASWSWFWGGTEETFVELWVHLKVEGSSHGRYPQWAESHLVALSDMTAVWDVSKDWPECQSNVLRTDQNPMAALPGMESELMEASAWIQNSIPILVSCDLSPVAPGSQTKQRCQGESPLWVPGLCYCKQRIWWWNAILKLYLGSHKFVADRSEASY